MNSFKLTWHRFPSFIEARESFRGKRCIYLQTDTDENILRVGESDDPWKRYNGGTAYALDAAGHNSGNQYFFAKVNEESKTRKAIEANLIFDLQPKYNTQHKKKPPQVRLQGCHTGDMPKMLSQSQ
jgi:hypothetical protein